MRSWAYQCQLKMKVAHYELRDFGPGCSILGGEVKI
jgi:hypothetical protein